MKKYLIISTVITLTTLIISGYMGGKMIPYQDPPQELLKEYNEYIKTYTPIYYIVTVIFVLALITTLILFAVYRARKK